MKMRIQPIVAGVCLGGMLLTGCTKEKEKDHPTTEIKDSTDIMTTEDGTEVEPADAPVSMIEPCELTQLEGREIISVSPVGDGETLYVSTCFEDPELAMSVYEVLRYDYQEQIESYGEPVVMEWEENGMSCIYFTTNQAGTKAYLSVLSENEDMEDLEESFLLRLATADIEGNQLKNMTLLEGAYELGNQIISGVDGEGNIYYVAEDMESGTLVAKVINGVQNDSGVELFSEDRIQMETPVEELEESQEEDGNLEEESQPDTGLEVESGKYPEDKTKEEDENQLTDGWKKNSISWEEVVNIRSIVKAEDGTYYFTAPGPSNGVYMIYSTSQQEDGLFAYPQLLSKEINDGVEDKLYCAVSTSQKYLYYLSSKSTMNEDGEFYSQTLLYRVLRRNLEEIQEQ